MLCIEHTLIFIEIFMQTLLQNSSFGWFVLVSLVAYQTLPEVNFCKGIVKGLIKTLYFTLQRAKL